MGNNKLRLGDAAFLREFQVQRGTQYSRLTVNVRRYFTDVDGQVIDKTTLPANLQKDLPFYIFGKYDFDSGYKAALEEVPPPEDWVYMYSFPVAREFSFLLNFSGLNNVKDRLRASDVVQLYTDDINNPNFFCFIQVGISLQSYSGLLLNMNSGKYLVNNFGYATDNFQQYTEPIAIVEQNPFSEPRRDFFQPLKYKPPSDFLRDDLTMRLKIQFSQYVGMYSRMKFATDLIDFSYNFEYNLLYINTDGVR